MSEEKEKIQEKLKSLRDRIKECDDVFKEVIHVDEWDCDVEIRSFSGLMRSNLIDDATKPDGTLDNDTLNKGVIINCVYDPESGEKLFDQSDVGWLMKKSAGALEGIIGAAMRVNKLTKKSRMEAEKN